MVIKLIVNYNFEKISKTLEDFYKATDIKTVWDLNENRQI